MRKKVTIIGSGFTGSTTAMFLAERELADIVLLDLPELENNTKGKALDMLEAMPIFNSDIRIVGSSDYIYSENSDIVVITAGMTRKKGMSRDDLLAINSKIMISVTEEIVKYSPNCIIIVLTNPVDAMTYRVLKTANFSKNRVIGQSGVLDTARLCTFIASELNVSVKDVSGLVLGGHGDSMVPLIRYTTVGGIPVEQFLSQEKISEIISRTRFGGGEIVELLGNGSAYYAPAAALLEMITAIIKDQKRLLPTVTYLDGEYGYYDVCVGVPTIIGSQGVEKIIELDLSPEEKEAFSKSVESVINLIK
ncbi:MAG TPA: malate dehydrogenase [Haloplasmataceae bacterium]